MHGEGSSLQSASKTPELSELAAMETALDLASIPDCLNPFHNHSMFRYRSLSLKEQVPATTECQFQISSTFFPMQTAFD